MIEVLVVVVVAVIVVSVVVLGVTNTTVCYRLSAICDPLRLPLP